MVSPGNSEDGNFPPVAEASRAAVAYQQAPVPYAAQITIAQQPSSQLMLQGIPLAPAPTGPIYNSVVMPQMQGGLGMMFQQQQIPGAGLGITAPKRRRVENGVMGEYALMPVAAPAGGVFSGQQLAAATDNAAHCRKKSQAQVDRRRERNRILARRTRLRKKFFFESLQKEIMDLQRENEMLKDVVKTDIGGDEGKQILDTCDAAERMPPGVLEACSEGGMDFDSQDFNLVRSIQASQNSFIITDPSLTDNPIVFASDGFLETTGYERDQVLGRNCRFLQGTDTNKESVDEVRKALSNGQDVSVTIINYTADGTPFWNKLFIAALRDANNNIVNYIGVVVKVASPEPGHPEHGKVLDGVKTDKIGDRAAESTIMAMADSVSAAVAAAGHYDD